MASRLIDRSKKSGKLGGSPGSPAVDFGSDGVAEGSLTAAQLAAVILRHPSISEVGQPGVETALAVAGNAATNIYTVPAAKYWRLIGAYVTLTTDATAANRQVVIKTRTAADATIDTITHATRAASGTQKTTTLFGQDDYVRSGQAVAAQGILTIAEPVTDGDQFTLNTTEFTLVAALTGAVNEILIGASEAATKLNLAAALGGTAKTGVHSVSSAVLASLGMTCNAAFVGDVLTFTANVKGTAGNSLVTVESGQGLTHASNIFNAGTLGTTTAGVDAASKVSTTLDYPDAGNLLGPGEDVIFTVTNGVAGDAFDSNLFYLEFDADPTP